MCSRGVTTRLETIALRHNLIICLLSRLRERYECSDGRAERNAGQSEFMQKAIALATENVTSGAAGRLARWLCAMAR